MQFIILSIFWFVGIWFASSFEGALPFLGWLGVFGVGMVGTWFLRRSPRLALGMACIGVFAAGGGRYLAAQPTIDPAHIAFYNGREDVTLTGLVVAEPDIRDRQINLRVAVDEIRDDEGQRQAVSGLVLVQTPRFPIIEYGTRIEVDGRLQTPPEDETFSYRDYLARQGIHSLMTWPHVRIMAERQGHPLYHAIFDYKARAQATINRILPAPESGLLSGILLGVDHAMPPGLDEDFRATGITHIVVISGFNISILAAIFIKLGDPFFGKRGAAFVAIGGIALYTIMVGAEASVVRAAIMGSAYVIGNRLLGRPNFALGSLFFAAFAMTLYNPLALWDVGFQLSFAATLSLMLYADPIIGWARVKLLRVVDRNTAERVMGVLSEAVLVTLAAQILTLPLLLAYFQQLSLVSLLANAFILPAQPGVMLWGGLATVTGMVLPAAGQLLGWIAYLFLAYTIGAARLFAQTPYAIVSVPFSPANLVLTYATIAAATWYLAQDVEDRLRLRARLSHDWRRRVLFGGSCAAVLLSWQWHVTQPDGVLHVAFLDVGQGDAIFIQTPSGRQILVDGGLYPTVLNDHLGRHIPFWDREIDVIVATHPDADHVSGLPGAFERYRVNQLIVSDAELGESAVYDAVLTAAQTQATATHRAVAGETIAVGDGVRLEVIHPGATRMPDGRNDNSVSFRLVYGDFRVLLTGDAEAAAEAEILETRFPLQAQVFKAGHHGANTSSGLPLLTAVSPQVVIVSAGEDNRFGHPHPDMLARAAAVGATVLRTDELGTIEVMSDGRRVWWQAGPE